MEYWFMEKDGMVATVLPIHARSTSGADGLDHARSLVANAARKLGLLRVLAAQEERLGAIQPGDLHLQTDFAVSGLLLGLFFELQNLRTA
jgi:hypothetical protein